MNQPFTAAQRRRSPPTPAKSSCCHQGCASVRTWLYRAPPEETKGLEPPERPGSANCCARAYPDVLLEGLAERHLVDRLTRAFETADIDGILALLTEDVWLTMPPLRAIQPTQSH